MSTLYLCNLITTSFTFTSEQYCLAHTHTHTLCPQHLWCNLAHCFLVHFVVRFWLLSCQDVTHFTFNLLYFWVFYRFFFYPIHNLWGYKLLHLVIDDCNFSSCLCVSVVQILLPYLYSLSIKFKMDVIAKLMACVRRVMACVRRALACVRCVMACVRRVMVKLTCVSDVVLFRCTWRSRRILSWASVYREEWEDEGIRSALMITYVSLTSCFNSSLRYSQRYWHL